MAKVFLILLAAIIGTVQAFADTEVSCLARNNQSLVTWQFVFSSNPSKRFVSGGILGHDASGNAFFIPFARLAQYSNDGKFIFMSTDDSFATENIVYEFSSRSGSKGTLPGTLTHFTNNEPDSVFLLFCTETQI